MKVLFICPFVPWPLETGGKIRTFHLIREASNHAEIHLRVVREPGAGREAEEALRDTCASVAFFDRRKPGPLGRWMRPKLERWFHSPELTREVRRELAREEFHLVHLDELLLARIVPPGPHVPVVQHHHKLDTVLYGTLWGDGGLPSRFDLWKLHRLESESARRYRHHLLCSEEDAEILRGRYGALDCAVVPSGFDPATFEPREPRLPRRSERIVFLGSMNYGPNVDGILRFVREVLPRIRTRRPGTHLQIVGADPNPEVRALACDHVEVTGRVDEVRPYLEEASLLVVPLRIGGGTRLKIVEALALETPVVSTTIGAEGLGLEDGEHLLLADDDEAFAGAVARLLDDPSEASRLGRAGRTFVHGRYRWEILGEELVEAWERVKFSGRLTPSR